MVLMKGNKEEKIIKAVTIITAVFFLIWGVLAVFTKNTEFVFDRFFSAAFAIFVYRFRNKINLKLHSLALGVLALTMHHLKLYGGVYLGIPFDKIMHFTAGFVLGLMLFYYFISLEPKKKPIYLKVILFAVIFTVGLGGLLEIVEFVGYSTLGPGEGVLFYGTGDFGEYNNTAWDLICNTLGALLSTMIITLLLLLKKENYMKYVVGAFMAALIIVLGPSALRNLSELKADTNVPSEVDFHSVLSQSGIDKDRFFLELTELSAKDITPFAKGDVMLALGRMTNNTLVICSSVDQYKKTSGSKEEKAMAYETIASLGCNYNQKKYYLKASEIWKEIGDDFRAEIDRKLAYGEQIVPEYDLSDEKEPEQQLRYGSDIIIGSSSITITSSDMLVSQADRVTRDWLSVQLSQSPYGDELLSVFSERFFLPQDELRYDLGWHEGARIKEISNIGLKRAVASGTLVAEISGKWYAPDENGIFRFEVPPDKISYPTTRFLRKDLAMVVDTHGVNMLVEQAVRYNATVVVGCCDTPGKVKAARYLAEKGIKVVCFTDRFVPDLMGSGLPVIGSAPIKLEDGNIILGDQPVRIGITEKIVVESRGSPDIQQYYDTPKRYIDDLDRISAVSLDIIEHDVTDDRDKGLVREARDVGAHVIAARIYSKTDYEELKPWLMEDKNNRVILLHSMPYPYGYLLFREFPNQTTFGDINPVFE